MGSDFIYSFLISAARISSLFKNPSSLIEIIEKLQDVDGKLGYYNLAPIVEKTFNIMGLTKYSSVFYSENEALEGIL